MPGLKPATSNLQPEVAGFVLPAPSLSGAKAQRPSSLRVGCSCERGREGSPHAPSRNVILHHGFRGGAPHPTVCTSIKMTPEQLWCVHMVSSFTTEM